MSVNRRYSPSELEDLGPPQLSSRPGYQGWAPSRGNPRSEGQSGPQPSNIPQSSADFYEEQRRLQHIAARYQQIQSRNNSTASESSGGSPGNESSLRTAALLQSVRRNAQLSTRSRTHLQHLLDRELAGESSQNRDQSFNASRQHIRNAIARDNALNELSRNQRLVDPERRADTPQESENRTPSEGKYHLDDAIQYLERLRFCESYQDSLSSAMAGGFIRHEFFTENHDDFILDTSMIEPPAETSWLRVGSVFSGSQHAPEQYIIHNRPENRDTPPDHNTTINRPTSRHGPPQPRQPDPYGAIDRAFAQIRTRFYRNTGLENIDPRFRITPLNPAAERSLQRSSHGDPWPTNWPVKIKIHSVNHDTMSIAGTMEAFNVPDKSSPTQESSITTYLEGEIIDFNKHTLETKSYTTAKDTDGKNWARLEPFKALDEEQIVRGLVSRRWMREELGAKYVLMRWKGRGPIFLLVRSWRKYAIADATLFRGARKMLCQAF